MKQFLLFILFSFMVSIAGAQVAPDKYYIQFTDKDNSPYSIDNPEEFLSQRAIDRRTKYDIPVTIKDLPVNPQYLQGISEFPVQILNPTKWLNGVTIYATDPNIINDIMALPYVENVRSIQSIHSKSSEEKEFFRNESFQKAEYEYPLKGTSQLDYGNGYNQIDMINGIPLHEAGYLGQGIVIAVLDAGYYGADFHNAFDSLRLNNQILGSKDFVDHSNTVYDYHTHGTSVLSTMGANVPGQLIGTAPGASYWLLRTEESTGAGPENIIEEYNWVSGAEFADSVGADLINSSLGYTTFDDPTQNHTHNELDGNTAVITIGADIAASRGIIVVNSAGNSGNDSWGRIGFPADGDSVFTIGAVNPSGIIASFSSYGPTADGRIKPNIAAQGAPAFVASAFGGFGDASGTSFSSPIICGMTACLLQANPLMTNMEIMNALMQSGSKANNPDNYYGWGIPDYAIALSFLTDITEQAAQEETLKIFPVPAENLLFFEINDTNITDCTAQLIDQSGRIVLNFDFQNGPYKRIEIPNIHVFSQGVYVLRIISQQRVLQKKFVKK